MERTDEMYGHEQTDSAANAEFLHRVQSMGFTAAGLDAVLESILRNHPNSENTGNGNVPAAAQKGN
jgi:hypothetical protein